MTNLVLSLALPWLEAAAAAAASAASTGLVVCMSSLSIRHRLNGKQSKRGAKRASKTMRQHPLAEATAAAVLIWQTAFTRVPSSQRTAKGGRVS